MQRCISFVQAPHYEYSYELLYEYEYSYCP